MSIISLVDVKKYYKELPHQKEAVEFLGALLLKTPAKNRLHLIYKDSWVKLEDSELQWLQSQISNRTLEKFTALWRIDLIESVEDQLEHYSQINNPILPYTSCNSSSHAMFTDYCLETKAKKPGLNGDNEFVRRVYSGKYGTYGRNNSVSWDIQIRVVRSFGINARYSNKGKNALIYELTNQNMVAPTNFRHKGGLRNSYGGHVVVAADYDPKKGFLIYDPFGYRMPNYTKQEEGQGIYWMSDREFDARWQGLFTQYVGLL